MNKHDVKIKIKTTVTPGKHHLGPQPSNTTYNNQHIF